MILSRSHWAAWTGMRAGTQNVSTSWARMDKDDWKFPEEQHFLSSKNVTERIKNEPNCYRGVNKQSTVPSDIPFRSKCALRLSQPTGKIRSRNAG